jgi:hypothetical protein
MTTSMVSATTTGSPSVKRHLDDQLLAPLVGQPPRVTIKLLSTSTGAVVRANRRVAEVSVGRLPDDVDPQSHRAPIADAYRLLELSGEWISDNPRGRQLGAGFDGLYVVELRPAGDPR